MLPGGCSAVGAAGCGPLASDAKLSACPVGPQPPPTAAGDARRWNGVRTVVQARALLKTVFRSASQHKAQASRAGKDQQQAAAAAAAAAANLSSPCLYKLALAGWRACLPACSSPSPCCPVLPVPQAYEAQAQVTELSEEMELLRLKLDIAEQEKFEAQQRVAGAFGWWCLAGGPAGWGPAASGGCVCCACCHAFMAARARTQHISCGCSVCAVCE